jgi:hypothetical protein
MHRFESRFPQVISREHREMDLPGQAVAVKPNRLPEEALEPIALYR